MFDLRCKHSFFQKLFTQFFLGVTAIYVLADFLPLNFNLISIEAVESEIASHKSALTEILNKIMTMSSKLCCLAVVWEGAEEAVDGGLTLLEGLVQTH